MKNNIRFNVIINIIRTVTITLLSFVSFPFVCRILGESALGTYTWANTFVYYFLTLAKLGIPTIAVRECSKVCDDKAALSKKTQEFFLIQAFLTICSFILMATIIFTLKGDLLANKDLIFLLSLNFLVGVFSFEWLFLALEKHFYVSFRSIATLLLSAVLIIILIRSPEQIYLYALFTMLSTFLIVICNCLYLRKFVSLKKVGKYNFRQYFKPLLIVFSISFILTLYNYNDCFILGYLDSTKAEVGNYSVGIKAVEIVLSIITSLSFVFIPQSTKYYKMANKAFFRNLTTYSMNICFFIAIPAVVTLILLAPDITKLISGNSNDFHNAVGVLMVLASIVLTFSISDIIYCQILLPMNKEKYYLFSMLGGVILNVSLSLSFALFFFKDTPSLGVGLGTAVTDLLILIVLVIMVHKHVLFAIVNLNNLKILLAGILVAIATYFLNSALSYLIPTLRLIAIILIDVFIYLGMLLITKERLVFSFFKKRDRENMPIKTE